MSGLAGMDGWQGSLRAPLSWVPGRVMVEMGMLSLRPLNQFFPEALAVWFRMRKRNKVVVRFIGRDG